MSSLLLYQSVFNSSPIGNYLLSPTSEAIILAVNDAFLLAASRTREELVGVSLFVAFPGNPDDPKDTGEAALRHSIAQAIATGKAATVPVQRYPIKITTLDGEERYEERFWQAVNTPIFDEDGQLLCISHTTIDVTKQALAEQQVHESVERARLAADAAEIGIWAWDIAADKAVWENERIYEIFGVPQTEEPLSFVRMTSEFVHPDDVVSFRKTFGNIQESDARLRYQGRFYRPPNRELRWFELTGMLHRGADGQPLRISGTVADITERKCVDAERQRYVSLAEHSTDFISMTDLHLHPFFVNRAGLAMVGLDSQEQAIKTSAADFFFPEDRHFIVNEFFPHAMANGNGEVEIRFRHFKTGEALWMIYSVYVLHDEHGKTIGHATVSRNITERKRAEEALKLADRRKDEFLAMLAHELRNPLAPIATAAQLLKIAGTDEKRVKQSSEIITRQVRHMTELIDDLLDVSRVTRGLVVLEKENLDLKSVVTSAIEQARPLIETRGHVLNIRMGAEHALVHADRTRLIQVIVNLLTNAAKYTPPGGEIVLGLEVSETEIKLCITDNGIGIEPSLLPHVFDLFTQAERTPDRSQGGLGLGLALVKSIMAMHGGRVEARSDGPGKGSSFTIILPLLKKDATEPCKTTEENLVSHATKPRRLMVVDDNLDAAQTLAALLETEGHQVTVKADPKSAIQAAAENPPDVFILDIGLPEMDGYALARHLRARPETAHATFIALTGYGQAHDKVRSKSAGIDYHFVKPMDAAQLIKILAQIY